jgi:para-aminobenzoate synthetase/4-amino-4-deoxychorismate lyase
LRNTFAGDPWELFLTLNKAQRSSYAAYIDLDQYSICSVSPELFLSLTNGKLTCKPMKGTIKRGFTTVEDQEKEKWLFSSEKNRAENVMIVDMIRNDMGTIATTGSVCVEKLFSIEKYPTVLQMTSTVTAAITAPIAEIFCKMFPCASITGAPKVKTMEIIKSLERDPRGIYTGSIGYIAPDGKAQFNVAIRTVVIDRKNNQAEYGVGGGITWDSEPKDEYDECKAKAAVLFQDYPEFHLIETILWDPDKGLYLIDDHIVRLLDSARYFEFDLSVADLNKQFDEFLSHRHKEKKKVRITVSRSGKVALETFPLLSMRGCKIALARDAISRGSQFIYHKTTSREIFQQRLAQRPEFDDVILWNEDAFITESCIANVVISYHGELVTPPINQGLLPGVFRKSLLEKGVIKEKDISIEDLFNSEEIFLINSVRGWMPLDKNEDNTWTIRSDFCYEAPYGQTA